MLSCFDFIRELSFASVALRLALALICGGAIGLEREYKRRPAGFRTHILICLGAAITTLTSQYLYLNMHLYTDIARLGAQVVAGIGFIGAGTIIVTKQRRVKGLTTAAGLWTAAIIGLVCGAGYVECALFATVMVLLAEILLIKFEFRFARQIRDMNLYVEYYEADSIEKIIHAIREEKVNISNLEISRVSNDEDEKQRLCAIITVQANKAIVDAVVIQKISEIDNVINIEEL